MASITDILSRAKRPILSMMIGTCDIQEYQTIVENNVTKHRLTTIYSGQPCKLSYSRNTATTEGEAPMVLLTVRLLLPSELVVRAGCIITVTQSGKTRTFEAAGEPAVYTNHQEIDLISADKYA